MREMKMRDMIMGETIMLERIDNAKRSFHRAANGIFGKVGRLASEEVVVQLLLHKCCYTMRSMVRIMGRALAVDEKV